MDVVADLPTNPQAAEPVQVGEATLNDPALGAESGTVFGAAQVVRRDELADARTVRFAEEGDAARVEVLLGVADHGGAVGPVRGTGHVDRPPRR